MGEAIQLRQEKERLHGRLAQVEAIVEIPKKLSQLLGLSPEIGKNSGWKRFKRQTNWGKGSGRPRPA
jgi:hypothetical protein